MAKPNRHRFVYLVPNTAQNFITNQGVAYLIRAHFPYLRRLFIGIPFSKKGTNSIDDKGVKILSNGPWRLQQLSLLRTCMDERGCQWLSTGNYLFERLIISILIVMKATKTMN